MGLPVMTQTPELLEVIQSDVDAVVRFYGYDDGRKRVLATPEHMRLARAFARHRIEHATPSPVEGRGERAIREAILLIDEINKRATSRAFNGIKGPLHAKLCTIRATLALAALPLPDEG